MNFDNETVEKRFLDFVWNRSMLKLVINNFPKTILSTRKNIGKRYIVENR